MKTNTEYKIITGRERPNLRDLQSDIILSAWPEFMLHDVYIDRYWEKIYKRFPEYQFVLMEKTTEKILAIGNSFPLPWESDLNNLPDQGLDWALEHCSIISIQADFISNVLFRLSLPGT